MRRKSIVWNKNQDTGHMEQKKLLPRRYVPDAVLMEETAVKFAPHLKPGMLWKVAEPWLSDVPEQAGYERPPYPYAMGTEYQPASRLICTLGTLAMYLGPTRVEESKYGGQMISVQRHTFMIHGNVYLIRRLADFEPVS